MISQALTLVAILKNALEFVRKNVNFKFCYPFGSG